MYYLKNKSSDVKTTIILAKRLNGKMFKYSTGLKVMPKHWDSKTKKVLNGQRCYRDYNSYLKNLKTGFESSVIRLQLKGILSHDTMRDSLDLFINRERKSKEEDVSFFGSWERWLAESTANGKKKGTVDKRRYTMNRLQEFENDTRFQLGFEKIDDSFRKAFYNWALSLKKGNGEKRFNKDNSIFKYINIVREYMNWANDEGLTSATGYKKMEKTEEEYFTTFALDQKDMQVLMNLSFDSINLNQYGVRPCNFQRTLKALKKTRDAFVFRALCGIRFSDYDALHQSKIQNGTLSLVSIKTGNQIRLPLHKYALFILEKYDCQVPKLHNSRENAELKLLGKICKFDEPFNKVYKRGGKIVSEDVKRYDMMTTHTARKTFITNCLRSGVPKYLVMEMVGIVKEETFQRYVQVAEVDLMDAMGKLSSFLKVE